jgi:hypothetical protein
MPATQTGPQTVVRAPESTENIPSARRVRDVARRINYLDPSASPFTIVSKQKANAASVFNTKFEWIEKKLPARWDQVNNGAGYASGATTIVVDNGAFFSVGDLVKVPRTGEVFRVTVVTVGSNSLDIIRGVGSTSAAALVDNDDLLIIGNAYTEGSLSGSEKSHQETYPYNYTQIIRTPFGVTGSEAESENYTGPDRPRLRAEKAIEHMIDIERTCLWGERNIDTSSTANPRRYTGGFDYFATSNGKNFNGIMTEAELEDWCEDLFHATAGGDTRFLACSPLAVSVIDQLGFGRLQLVPKDTTLGIAVKQFVTSHGTLFITKHRLLDNGLGGGGYGGVIKALDPNKIGYRYLRNRNTKLRMDIQAPDLDGFKDEYLTEVGFAVMNPEVHGTGTGITG